MTDDEFWMIVERAGADSDPTSSVADALSARPASESIDFDRRLNNALRRAHGPDLWTVAELATGSLTDADFEYFRLWLIFLGRETFRAVMAEPDLLSELSPGKDGYLVDGPQYVAWQVYRAKTGEQMPAKRDPLPHLEVVWTFDDPAVTASRFPRTWSQAHR